MQILMPKMGESIIEATILRWHKKVGDLIKEDEILADIATDKVDTEVPSPASGIIKELLFAEGAAVAVNAVIAVIETKAVASIPIISPAETQKSIEKPSIEKNIGRFYSPLVKNIAQKEGIVPVELEKVNGSGANGRVTKHDILQYVSSRTTEIPLNPAPSPISQSPNLQSPIPNSPKSGQVEIIEMDRMRRMIADHMTHSVQISPHVTSFVEVDVTNMVNWRTKIQADFQKKYNEKITYTPIFIQAVVKALHDFPMVNVSVDGTTIIRKKYIHIGMAAALPSGNLIVPVIKNADFLNLVGLSKAVNDLANRARANQLKPEDVQDGTFTVTNIGQFGNIMGTPIINQPQAAILALGAIRKKPAVIETEYGDVIAVRQMMFLSLSYDHRVVDGALGGSFLKRIGDYLEGFDGKQGI
jgi:2-oxoglutarate dehydrogenase E2 component (dihydrolipoamide succinyltransferase)